MKIGLLIIGTEVLKGQIQDSNTQYLAKFLSSHHLDLHLTLTVGDKEQEILEGLSYLFKQCQVVLTSGGLGPTEDDLTKKLVAQYFQKKLLYSEQAFMIASAHYQRADRSFAGKEHTYCFIPENFIPIENPAGFAPSLFYRDHDQAILCLPGVPREFHAIIEQHFDSLFGWVKPQGKIQHLFSVRTKRVPEEKIFKELCPTLWWSLEKYGKVASLPHMMGVDICVHVEAKDAKELENKIFELQNIFEDSALKPFIWHYGTESLEEVILLKAREKNVKIAFAESCTGGLNAHRLTNIPGSSSHFWGGVVSYDNSVKEKILNVSKDTLLSHGAVSEGCALEMSRGVRHALEVDIAISTTGIAGPSGGSLEKPVGTVWVGISTTQKNFAKKYYFQGNREHLKQRFSQVALIHLLEVLLED